MPINWPIALSIPGTIGAAIGVWVLLGFPTLATSSDIQRLDRKQADVAVEVYDNKLRRYLAAQPPSDPIALQNWNEEIRRSKIQLDQAEKRRIDLSR